MDQRYSPEQLIAQDSVLAEMRGLAVAKLKVQEQSRDHIPGFVLGTPQLLKLFRAFGVAIADQIGFTEVNIRLEFSPARYAGMRTTQQLGERVPGIAETFKRIHIENSKGR